ncbi:hypothetical protein Lfu02_73300 [Longispora fulva]|uniref:Putative membrane protein n=1 Tax=Longispora fulva TaxID=619741 RepID=A0A8J7GAR6_9ACTN|nr:hypothetical protein [Longispora fulva]MBG6133916.1 putative membrane protein [Longispora fulva]GIG62958.1 hypothetical protein Lfu02_73300 [Longispora fulva]
MSRPARVAIWATCLALLILAAGFVLLGSVKGNYPAQVLGALGAVAAIGVTLWASLRSGQSGSREVRRSGDATASGSGSVAITGMVGGGGGRLVEDTGSARAEGGGRAITGDEQ